MSIDWDIASLEFWKEEARRLAEENVLLRREINSLHDPDGKRFEDLMNTTASDPQLPQEFLDCFKGLLKEE